MASKNLKINEKYVITSSYDNKDSSGDKISVSNGDVVSIVSIDGDWTEVVNVKTKVKGRIPTDNIGDTVLITGGNSIGWFGWNVDAVLINSFLVFAAAILTFQKYNYAFENAL